jgi:hypothetical protein
MERFIKELLEARAMTMDVEAKRTGLNNFTKYDHISINAMNKHNTIANANKTFIKKRTHLVNS